MEQQFKDLKKDVSLFSKLYICCQTRNGDLCEFSMHENQACPPSISKNGDILSSSKKSELLTDCIEPMVDGNNLMEPSCETIVIDAPVVVQSRAPGNAKTFSEYSNNVFIPYITRLLEKYKRVDVIWDEYIDNSLKASACALHGKGCRRRILPKTRIPGDW